jgi:mycothiol synthase
MTIISRAYTKDDFQACSDMLIESYCLSQDLSNWSLRHWEGQAFHRSNLRDFPDRAIHLWEDNGKVIAFAHAEYTGSAFFQVLPQYRQMEANMLAWAERHLAVVKTGHLVLETWVFEADKQRQDLLVSCGYEQDKFHMLNRRRDMNQAIPSAALANNYHIRGMNRSAADCRQVANLLNAAFNRDFHKPEEYMNFQTAPHYRPEYDFVAVASDGTIAANAQLTIVEENSYAEFEPVCTHPEHQRKGLARALMATGLKVLQAKGIKTAYVDAASDNPASNALYEQMGFTDAKRLYLWKKSW